MQLCLMATLVDPSPAQPKPLQVWVGKWGGKICKQEGFEMLCYYFFQF